MAVGEAINQIQYSGNDSTVTAYPVPFRFDDESWLIVRQIDELGITTLTHGIDYAITGNTTAGAGQIITSDPVPTSNTLAIARNAPALQTLSLIPNSPLPSADLEAALDRIVMAVQDNSAALTEEIPFYSAILTANGNYTIPTTIGVTYLLAIKGTFDGGTVTMTYLAAEGTYDSIDEASWTAPAEQDFLSPSVTMRLTLSNAGASTSIRILVIAHNKTP